MSNQKQKSLIDRVSKVIDNFLSKDRVMPFRSAILDNHVDATNYNPEPLVKEKHYFIVEINELFLKEQSKLWVDLDPTVFVTTEFEYNKNMEAVPFIVGPSMIQSHQEKIAKGMIFSNTKVAGIHPYKGNNLNLTVVLCSVKRNDSAKRVLKFVEAASGALDYSTALSQYLKVADVVIDGIEDMMGLKSEIMPIIGLRVGFSPEVKNDLKQSYYVLINTPDKIAFNDKLIEKLWVKDDCLYVGENREKAEPYRDADYVLYSIRGTEKRAVNMLPFESTWERVQQQAMEAEPKIYEKAKAEMLSLFQSMYLSPDMTKKHALQLKDERVKEMITLHKEALEISEFNEPLLAAKLGAKKKSKKTREELQILVEDENLKNANDILKA